MAADLALPKEATAVLEWWFPRIRQILGPRLHSVMLYGSVCLDGFEPGWSDVDMCTVVEEPVSKEEALALDRVHEEMDKRFIEEGQGGWRNTQILEGEIIPVDLAEDGDATGVCYATMAGHRERKVCNPLSAFYRYLLAYHGVCYAGKHVRFAPPSREALTAETRELMLTGQGALLRPERAGASGIMMAGIIQDTARTIVFWRDGALLSKTAALEHEIAGGSPFVAAYRLALHLRKIGSAKCEAHRDELRARLLEIVVPAADLLRHLLAAEEGTQKRKGATCL
ncbi:hypothetical protein H8D79_01270 [PVC group bacterium]|nr:hypothetical protein [PVC group bacterium]